MKLEEINFLDIKTELEHSKLPYKYRLEPTFVNYLKEYNSKSSFEDISFIIRSNNSTLYCPLTIEKSKDKNFLNFLETHFP